MLGVVETEDLEIDLYVGETSTLVRGVRIYQCLDREEEDKQGDTEAEEGEDDDEDDDADVLIYDFVATPSAEIQGQQIFKGALGKPKDFIESEENNTGSNADEQEIPDETTDDIWINLAVYSSDGDVNSELTCVCVNHGPDLAEETVFLEDVELE